MPPDGSDYNIPKVTTEGHEGSMSDEALKPMTPPHTKDILWNVVE